MKRTGFGLAIAMLLLTACAEPVETRARFQAMGTLVDVTVYDAPPEEARAALRGCRRPRRTGRLSHARLRHLKNSFSIHPSSLSSLRFSG